MNLEAARTGVLFVAAFIQADKGLLARVNDFMCFKVPFCDEFKIALHALKRSLSRVTSNMSLKIASLAEFFEALFKWAYQ